MFETFENFSWQTLATPCEDHVEVGSLRVRPSLHFVWRAQAQQYVPPDTRVLFTTSCGLIKYSSTQNPPRSMGTWQYKEWWCAKSELFFHTAGHLCTRPPSLYPDATHLHALLTDADV